ncbi:MAG: hypothetical protein D3924_13730, partial [Candidatus Electrothrix sp. AR4]|nr:hypothetical protein [Candidatus Electrothrix sp. AR4]
MQLKNTEATAEIMLNAEYDDNIYLSNESEKEEIKGDMVFHVIPSIKLMHSYIDHALDFNLTGDYRKATDSKISDININTSAGVNLNFPGGLSVGLVD